jgi:hypothetical protein
MTEEEIVYDLLKTWQKRFRAPRIDLSEVSRHYDWQWAGWFLMGVGAGVSIGGALVFFYIGVM